MSSDPAVKAAARAWHDRYGDRLVGVEDSAAHNGVGELAIAAAREALKPLRGLHFQSTRIPSRDFMKCVSCHTPWPCTTAKLVYPAEEMT